MTNSQRPSIRRTTKIHQTTKRIAAVAVVVLLFSVANQARADQAAPLPQKMKSAPSPIFLVSPQVPYKPSPPKDTTPGCVADDYRPFMKDVANRIKAKWHEPDGFEGKIVVHFDLKKGEHVSGVKVTKSCGNDSFDAMARRAVLDATRSLRLPDLTEAPLEIDYTFKPASEGD